MAVECHLFRALVGEDVDQQAVVRNTKDSLEHKLELVIGSHRLQRVLEPAVLLLPLAVVAFDRTVVLFLFNDRAIKRYRGEWKNGWLEYTVETVRVAENERVFVVKRVFRVTDDGLLVYVFTNKTAKQVALYRHPEDIALPEPAKVTSADMAWLAEAWTGMRRASSIEERWSPPKGGAMLGVSRTVSGEKMTAFEYLRIVERDGGLVYVAQPGGRSPTEFVLTELDNQRAVFVNPRHDYPQRIVYELSNEGALTASIGFAKGRLQSYEFTPEGD